MRKYATQFSSLIALGVGVAFRVEAAYRPIYTAPTFRDVRQVIRDVVCPTMRVLFDFLIILSIAFIIIAAYRYLTSGGEPEGVRGATRMITYSVVALVVGILARSVPAIIGDIINFDGGSALGC